MAKLFFFSVFLIPVISFSQSDSTKQSDNSLILNLRFSGVQVEATSLVLINELGGLIDFDLYSSHNKYNNLGLRLSVEYSTVVPLDFGGSGNKETNTNYNLYARHTIKGSLFWFSLLLGASIQKFSNDYKREISFVPRAGFELRYNLSNYEIAFLLKGARSFIEPAVYIGLGISFGFHKL